MWKKSSQGGHKKRREREREREKDSERNWRDGIYKLIFSPFPVTVKVLMILSLYQVYKELSKGCFYCLTDAHQPNLFALQMD